MPDFLAARPVKWLALSIACWLFWCGHAGAQMPPLRGYLTAHDPSTITVCSNRYYLFYTGYGIQSKSSADKVFWKPGPPVFTNPPAWTTKAVPGFDGTFWAPDLLYFNHEYHLYYAVSTFGSQVSAIGLVTNPTLNPADPAYHWTDQGPVITSTNGSPYNVIDPSFSWDNSGNLWMAFGSYWNGIYLVQLDATTGLRIASNSPAYHLAYNSSIEASYLWRRGGYYYLFANWGSCCSGVDSTYNIRVGRSTSITGPYLDHNGVDMAANGGTLFMQASGKYTGPGHVGILSEGGTLSLTHHYYDANSWAPQYGAYGSPKFALLPLCWTADDWPYVTNRWSAVYNFQADARDDNGQYYGLLENGAMAVTNGVYGHVLNLNGTNQYVWLPPGMAYARTFSAVVNWRGGGAGQRLFDFGLATNRTLSLTPANAANELQFAINSGSELQTVQWTQPLPSNTWTHVAITLNGEQGVLYVNGAPVTTNAGMTLLPLNVAPQTNHLGRSKSATDPYFNGQIASFRAYGRVLSPAEMVAPMPTIAQPADGAAYGPGEALNFSGAATDFANRPLSSASLSWQIDYVQDGHTNLVFGPIIGAGGTFNLPTNATGGGTYQVVLTATDIFNRRSSATARLSPANPPAAWSSYYPLQASANDANGHYNGSLRGGAAFVNDAARGPVLSLSGTNQYVAFPAGLAGMKTFMGWVKWNGGAAWQRIYDFGNDTNRYTILTPAAGNGKLRYNISIDSVPGEQVADAPAPLPVNVWTHVAVVMNGTSAVIYTNGAPVATNLFANLLPADLNATNIYFGRSQWPADPYFSGELSSVRIFSRSLAPAEIIAPQVAIASPAPGATFHPGDTVGFGGGANDFFDAAIAATNLTWTIGFVNSGTTNMVLGPFSGVTNGTFTLPASGASATNGSYQIWLRAVDSAGRAATNSVSIYPVAAMAPSAWNSVYPFTGGPQDVSNHLNGVFVNGASIVNDAARGNVLNLNAAAAQYVKLPAGVAGAETIAGWVKWNGGNDWQRIFDFGENTSQYFFLTPADASSLPQCGITPDDSIYIQVIESPVTLATGQWTQVAVVMDGRQGMLYLNGNAVALNNSVDLLPSDIGATNCWLGRSEFSADPYFNGRLSAMRLDSAAVPFAQLEAPVPAITQPTNGSLFAGGQAISFAANAVDYSGALLGSNAFTWTGQLYSNGLAFTILGPVGGLTNVSYVVPTNLIATTNLYFAFNLTVTDTNGRQATASATVLPQTSVMGFQTVPAGLALDLDGQSLGGTSMVAVAGMDHVLDAPSPQTLLGSNYQFVVWSDGGANSHVIVVPATNTLYTAGFVAPALGLAVGAGSLSLTWPQWAAAMALYVTTNLNPPAAWSPVTLAPVLSNGAFELEVPETNLGVFFRLQLP